ncbi:hypothetical protein T4D_17115 [Trichinella pseudospiralis]|uniref:Uncharacterized protein n=1 Tax=Trichinella pseudospiralis TaxID=6337 RepID=A0A0V1EZ30_TRIPS|nr:hypothetical protein T4D_17115 [Trichinella pseudospiralis]
MGIHYDVMKHRLVFNPMSKSVDFTVLMDAKTVAILIYFSFQYFYLTE